MNPVGVLLVDDEPLFLEAVRESLTLTDEYHFDFAFSAEEALNKLNNTRYDVIVSDYSMPEMDGVELLIQIRKFSNIPFILFTGKDDENVVIDAINNGVDFYLKKGEELNLMFAELAFMIRMGAYKNQSYKKLHENEQKYRELFEKSPVATMIYDPERTLIDINHAALSLFGIPSASDVIGTSLFKHHNLTEDTINRLKAGETVRYSTIVDFDLIRSEHAYPCNRDGTIFIDLSLIPHIEFDGSISTYYVQIIDLTAEHRAEEKLRDNKNN